MTMSERGSYVGVETHQACDNAECHQIVNKLDMNFAGGRISGMACLVVAHLIQRAFLLSINLIDRHQFGQATRKNPVISAMNVLL